jgi:hypothetical protein
MQTLGGVVAGNGLQRATQERLFSPVPYTVRYVGFPHSETATGKPGFPRQPYVFGSYRIWSRTDTNIREYIIYTYVPLVGFGTNLAHFSQLQCHAAHVRWTNFT